MTRTEPIRRPPELAEETTRIIPLGGLGKIGRNMTTFEHNGEILIVDCGVLFPRDQPGVDLILPDFRELLDRIDDITAIVLTHGHEDHIGALPYLLAHRPDIPLIGSRLTLALVAAKCAEHRLRPQSQIVSAGGVHTYGPFTCEFLAVNHSIPDALAVAIRTSAGTILHTGDFKADQLPLDGRLTDLRGFARLGERGVDLFLTDSTNADVPGFTVSEAQLVPAIQQVFAQTSGRIIVASFASHVHRIQQIIDAAAVADRVISFVGRSMVRNMGIAVELGYLKIPEGLEVSLAELSQYPPENTVVICTGSQGEPLAALSRMASGSHALRVGSGDTVLMASSLIPGNENAVYDVMNGLLARGVNLVHKGNALVHVSGHAAAGELLYCYNLVQPRQVMPVHGEWRHLLANAEIARSSGVPADNVLVGSNGMVVDLQRGKARVVGQIPNEMVYVESGRVGLTDEDLLEERRTLRDEGLISITLVVDLSARRLLSPVTLRTRGVVLPDDSAELISKRATEAAAAKIGHANNVTELQQVIRRSIGGYVGGKLRIRPLLLPIVIDTSNR